MNYREIEIKLPIEDIEETTEKVLSLGAELQENRHFEDNLVFDNESQDLRKQGVLLRLRVNRSNVETHPQCILTYKGKVDLSSGVRNREEIETQIGEPEHMIRILSNLSYFPVFRYQKYRAVYQIQDVDLDFCVDETPIGNYLELEGDPDAIHEYAARLGYRKDQYVTESYGGLYLRWCEEKGFKPANMIFP
jgi:adenylate cyclase class 2